MTKTITAVCLGIISFSMAACGSASSPESPTSLVSPSGIDAAKMPMSAKPDVAAAAKPGSLTIVGIVLQDDGEFDVLQAAVVRAGLASALDDPRQYTVFAPTDNAFVTALGVDDEAAAIAAVNGLPIEKLTDILLFHVTAGRRHSRSVLAAPSYEMLNGATLVRQQLVAAGLAATDISASNGIVHVINAVLLPSQ